MVVQVYKHIPVISPLQPMAYTLISKLLAKIDKIYYFPDKMFPRYQMASHMTGKSVFGDCHIVLRFQHLESVNIFHQKHTAAYCIS